MTILNTILVLKVVFSFLNKFHYEQIDTIHDPKYVGLWDEPSMRRNITDLPIELDTHGFYHPDKGVVFTLEIHLDMIYIKTLIFILLLKQVLMNYFCQKNSETYLYVSSFIYSIRS